ncbi:protein PBDC1 [Rhynchophorus ferrugineus]|uniref:Polysaccharide biosynthesis domain-containing protein n=1 Tax=Rhynchophorus ferrugineus TaxID=354439 RepID=A0A834I5R4_RHYFE|nr:hypothetical protein GWI33_013832 [Rhynchophorus ferrugineus]
MDVLSRPAEEFENDKSVEAIWAMKAYEHAEIYFNILCSVDPKDLHLSPEDDLIYRLFREEFPNLKIDIIIENELKSTKEKAKWRPFCERFKTVIEDYNYGTLLRSDSSMDYCEENTMLVTKIQFLAIEIARNREGINDILRSKFMPEPKRKDEQVIENS